MTIAVIGAGASGMMAALTAAETPENEILLFERQARVGRKLAVTGNGRCNLTNTGAAPENYHGTQPEFAARTLAAFPPAAALDWFAAHGLLTVTEPGGRVYPLSNAANSVVDVLRFALAQPNITLHTGDAVTAVRRQGRGNRYGFNRLFIRAHKVAHVHQQAEVRMVHGRDELLDSWHTLLIPKIVSALMLPDEAEQYRAMKSLGVWLSGSLGFTPGTIGGIKPDGTTFHHGGFYPAYSTGAFAMIGYFCKATRGTDFTLSEQARRNFKLALMTMASYTDLRDWGLGLAGRHPFGKNGRIPDADVNAFGYLAALTGSGKGADPELAGAYLRLKGTDKELNSLFRKEGISAGPTPSGFFVYNYGAAGIHRRGDWMVTLKAFNTDVWGSEIYTKDNRYGRYQSYGSAPIIGSGNPVSAAASGFVQEGWDWNRVPGATTIHLPYPELESPLPGTLMERNPERFSGASSLEGRNGILALHFVEKDRKNFTPGATAYKSVFCFDNRMVFLGSGIDNDNQAYPTETTLFQLRMDSPAEQIEVDGELYDAFPLNLSKGGERLALSDTKGNFYVVKNAAAVNITKKEQTSPNDKTRAPQTGNFATAWIDHGRAPKQAGYEYAVYIQPTNKEITRLIKKDGYEVLRRDNTAHVVKDLATGITGYVCFGEYTGQGLVRKATGESIVMERTDTDGQVVMSVCTPDLGLTEKTYTTRQESRPIEKEVLLDGAWELAAQYPGVEAVSHDTGTLLKITCRHGQPVEFRLKKK